MTLAEPTSLEYLRQKFAALPPPVVVFNKSHSGSRLLAQLIESAGVYMGARLNESNDALSLLPLVEYVVERYYPDFTALLDKKAPSDEHLCRLIDRAIFEHMTNYKSGPWGWKLCETVYILPLLDYLFPHARYIHLIRDGRDVAFSNHVAPVIPFWQKVYINSVGVRLRRGLVYGRGAGFCYRLAAPLYNMQHWMNSVTVGRRYGAQLGERYYEIRYEDLCLDFSATARRVLGFIGLPLLPTLAEELGASVQTQKVGKHRLYNPVIRWLVAWYGRSVLRLFGYTD